VARPIQRAVLEFGKSGCHSRRLVMKSELRMIYWKEGKFWLGKIREHPEIMTQGRTLKELEENLRDAYALMVMDDVPEKHQEKAIAV
jgi:predicted RNase H-like HicB family nuclease